jgi:hypothetical protein
MAFREKNFLTSMLDQIGAVFERVLKLRRANKQQEALVLLDGARQDLIGVPRALLERLDGASAARLIGDPAKIRAWARLRREESLVLGELGRGGADELRNAAELMIEATRLSPTTSEDMTFLREVADTIADGILGARDQARLNELIGEGSAS